MSSTVFVEAVVGLLGGELGVALKMVAEPGKISGRGPDVVVVPLEEVAVGGDSGMLLTTGLEG